MLNITFMELADMIAKYIATTLITFKERSCYRRVFITWLNMSGKNMTVKNSVDEVFATEH